MTTPKAPRRELPEVRVPAVDERGNAAFLDTLFDTDGRPSREAGAVAEAEGDEDDDQP